MKIKYNSKSHDLLKIAKVFNGPFTVKDVRYVLAVFDKDSRVKESADILISHGLLVKIDDNSYAITPEGRRGLFEMVKQHSLKTMLSSNAVN
jgi:Mn-dependent DtxR family transcriptional regulator